MKHDDLVRFATSANVTVLTTGLVALFKYGDRSDLYARSIESSDRTVGIIQESLASDLADAIREAEGTDQTQPSLLLGPNGETQSYSERAVRFTSSELFRDAVTGFVAGNAESISCFRSLLTARRRWCAWAQALSWTIMLVEGWQVMSVLTTCFVERVVDARLPDWSIYGALAVTALLVVFAVVVAMPAQMVMHDTIMHHRERLAAPKN